MNSNPAFEGNPAQNQRPDGLLNAIPVIQCRNEERFIAAVLRPLVDVFGYALVGDTGSDDGTLPILRQWAAEGKIGLTEYGVLGLPAVGRVRAELGQQALALGARFIFLCDADEIYNLRALQAVARTVMPEDKWLGFTCGINIEETNERWYDLAEPVCRCGRTAVIRSTDTWHGDYPFEGPSDFDHPDKFFYFPAPTHIRYHFLHVHRLWRSSRDATVPYRVQKRYQFCMADYPNVQLADEVDKAAWFTPYKELP
jgi:glycosyltransferase involved in cell wall biosynthesis